MQNERDVWNTTYFPRAIRKRIGEVLSARYDLSEPMPNRMRALLAQLDEPNAETDRGQPLPTASSPCPRSSRPGGCEVIEVPVRRQ
jgi:hypothetical protein